MKKEVKKVKEVRTINANMFEFIEKARKNQSETFVSAIIRNYGFASDKLVKGDFAVSTDFDLWKKTVNDIRCNCYNLAIARKNNVMLISEHTNNVYYLIKTLCNLFSVPVKLDGKTAEYLSGKAISTGNIYSSEIEKLKSEISNYRKQQRIAKNDKLFSAEIKERQEKIQGLKTISCNAMKCEKITSESAFRKAFEDYLAFRILGLHDEYM